jgi:hypothetical protein
LTILPPSLPGSEGDVVLQMNKNIKHGKSSSNADGEGEEEGSLIYRFSGDGEKVFLDNSSSSCFIDNLAYYSSVIIDIDL